MTDHICKTGKRPQDFNSTGHGPAVSYVLVTKDGLFDIGNDEYGTTCLYCPFCGEACPSLKKD